MPNVNEYVQMNLDRASWADKAIKAFVRATRVDKEDALADLLCDLMHWCDVNKQEFDAALQSAYSNYDAEKTVKCCVCTHVLSAEFAVMEGGEHYCSQGCVDSVK